MNKRLAQSWLESQSDELVADLITLCDQNSGSHHLPGLIRVADWLSEWADLSPATFQRISLPAYESIDDAGQVKSVETAPALRWDFKPDASRRVLLMIHYDTVYGVEHPFQQCQRLSSTLLQGPGVADAKGGIVVLRSALQALLKFELASDLGWTVLLNPDEEVGSHSSLALMQELAPQYDFGLLFEPALPTGELISERKGSGTFSVLVHGKAAHAGRNFQLGRNAVAELSRIVAALDQLNGQREDTTINVGYLSGGGPVNVVPDRAMARVNVRVADSESAMWFQQQLQAIARRTSEREGFDCHVTGGFTSPPKRIDAAQQELMQAISVCSMKLGLPSVSWRYTGGVCDGNKLAAAGLPNIDTLGPRGDGLHSEFESVQLDSLVEKAQLIVEVLCGYAQGEFENLRREKVRTLAALPPGNFG